MGARRFDNFNSNHERERASALLKNWYRTHAGEAVRRVRIKRVEGLRRSNDYIYECPEVWEAGQRMVRLATVEKEDGKSYLIGFDVLLHSRGHDVLTELIEFSKAGGGTIQTHSVQKPFAVTRRWKLCQA